MPTLATTESCTGCAACGTICPRSAIAMRERSDGFLMPRVDPAKCIECKLCERVCPVIKGQGEALKHPTPERAYALWSHPDRILSSSGGAFSAVARVILARGGVVYGASWQNGFDCRHVSIERVEDLPLLRGSKYLQSAIDDSYAGAKEYLEQGRWVLFTGTPCQVAGLRSFLRRPYDKLVCMDIVCHGVPSNLLFKKYVEKLRREYPKYGACDGFSFRNARAWGYAPRASVRDSWLPLCGIHDIYMKAFDKALIFRESCYDCRFNGLSRVGDLTVADFWGVGRCGVPFRHDVTKGVSLVLPNSPKGVDLLSELKDVFMEQRPVGEAVPYNNNLVNSSPRNPLRESVIADFLDPDIPLSRIDNKYCLVGRSASARVKGLLIRMGLFYPLKSLYNKITLLR